MFPFVHMRDPLTADEWSDLMGVVKAVGDATVTRRFIDTTGPLGAGVQTVPTERLVGITEGYRSALGTNGQAVAVGERESGIVPLILKDFTIHWRDLGEARLTNQRISMAKAAAAASSCARSEDRFVFFGHQELGYKGLMTTPGRNVVSELRWKQPGYAFDNFTMMIHLLMSKGYTGPFAAVVHPGIFAAMHRVLAGSSLLEIAHVKALLTGGIFRSSLLAPRTGFVVATGRQNLELIVSIDTSIAFLGSRQMNLPFRVFKAIYLRILRSDAICTFSSSDEEARITLDDR